MRKLAGLFCLVLVAAFAAPAVAFSAGGPKLVEGLVYEGWCTGPGVEGCPAEPFPGCLSPVPCDLNYKPFTTEGTIVNVRRHGSPIVVRSVTAVEGRFQVELGTGRYVLHAIPPPESCAHGESQRLAINAKIAGPFYVPVGVYSYGSLQADGSCAVYPHP